jgi:hypothetical protein
VLGCHLLVLGNQIQEKQMIQWESQVENWVQKASARTPEARSEKLHKRNMSQLVRDDMFELIMNLLYMEMEMHL